jgi:hypothetical protein
MLPKLLKRVLSAYPYLIKSTTNIPEIDSLPLSFSSSQTKREDDTDILASNYLGILKIYETFLNLLVSQEAEDINDTIEPNFLKKTKESLKSLKSKGYTLRTAGDLLYTTIFKIKNERYVGSVLPQRNLNFPKDHYTHYYSKSSNYDQNLYIYKNPGKLIVNKEDFKGIDLEMLSQMENPHQIDKRIEKLIVYLNYMRMACLSYDFGIYSQFKVFVEDLDGKIVAGKCDDSWEFHTLRIETCSYVKSTFEWLFGDDGRRKMTSELFEKYMLNFRLIDFDGFMNKNLIIN